MAYGKNSFKRGKDQLFGGYENLFTLFITEYGSWAVCKKEQMNY